LSLKGAPGSDAALDVRAAIFEAAGTEVASVGFADTLVKRIATHARVSIGTFYSYFEGREEFLSALLRYARRQVTRYISGAVEGSKTFAELEVRSFQALFELVTQRPWLTRLAAEAAAWKPQEYQHHFAVISRSYRRKMTAAKARGELASYTDDEIESLSIIFTAARRFLGARFVGHSAGALPKWVVRSYIQLVCCGLAANDRAPFKQPARQ
jgi:AcrR family transcriptional regulator